MTNITMDLTGLHENYAESGKVFRIFKDGQYINFETPIFKESLKVYLISSGISDTLLELDKDYIIPESAITYCDNDLSKAKILDKDFNKELISGIQMVNPEHVIYTVSISYQRLYPNQLLTAYVQNTPLNLTPELLYDMISSIENLKILTKRITETSSINHGDSILLEIDSSKTNPLNFIENEVHQVNVPGGSFIIHPKAGSFYLDSISIRHPGTNTVLVKDKDYFIKGMDEAKTKATSHSSPVYQYIILVVPIVDTVEISYHAFGGEPTIDNYRELLDDIVNITNYINNNKTLTPESIGSTPVISDLFKRIEKMELDMRRLQQTPSYGDVTHGKSTLMKLFADTPGMHWYTIASLYKIEGNDAPITADTFTFRLSSKETHFQFTASVAVDLFNTEGDIFNVSVLNDNYPRGYVPFEDYSQIDKLIKPQLRIVWKDSAQASGIYLQLGFELKNILEETVVIEDMSGTESCWKLVDGIATVTTPKDDDFMLPSGEVWSSYLENAKQSTTLIPFKKGHLVWAGMQPMNRPMEGWQVFNVENDLLLLDNTTDFRRFTKLRLDIEEQDGFQFPIDINLNTGSGEVMKGHASFTHQEKPAYINAELYRENGNIKLRLNYDITAGVGSNLLNLRDIVVFL